MAAQIPPPTRLRPARGRGGPRPPRQPQSVEVAPPPHPWRPALAVAGIPPWRDSGWWSVPSWTASTRRDSGPRSRRAGQRTRRAQAPKVWLGGHWQRCQGCIRAGRPCGPIASPSRPASGGRGRIARGPQRDCSRPDRRGRPDQHSVGRVGAWAWGGAGRESAEQPPSAIPGGWFWEWQRFPWEPARRAARPTRQARWQRAQGPGGREGQARQGQGQAWQGQRQVVLHRRGRRHPPCLAQNGVALGQGRQAAVPEDPRRAPPLPRSRGPRPGRGTSRGNFRLTTPVCSSRTADHPGFRPGRG